MIVLVLLIAAGAVIISTIICRPLLLAHNVFLGEFVSHEALALLAVVLTVTLASVANIHLAINRMVSEKFKNEPNLVALASEIKAELRQNCWFIFGAFAACFFLLIWKGALSSDVTTLAIVHGAVLWIFLLYICVMYDVYRVVFGFVTLDEKGGSSEGVLPSESP
jgi:hypothetical protein